MGIKRGCFEYTWCLLFTDRCDPSIGNMTCCTSAQPCHVGFGDCDNDDECVGNLVCGVDNYDTSSIDVCQLGKFIWNSWKNKNYLHIETMNNMFQRCLMVTI